MADIATYRLNLYSTKPRSDGRAILTPTGWQLVKVGNFEALNPVDYTSDQGAFSSDKEITGSMEINEDSFLTPFTGAGGNVTIPAA